MPGPYCVAFRPPTAGSCRRGYVRADGEGGGADSANVPPTVPPREKPQQIADELRQLIVNGELQRGRLARPRARAGRALRRVAALAPRGAAHPRGRGADHRRPGRARRRRRARARRAHDGPHGGAGAPGPQRLAGRRLRGAASSRARGRPPRRRRRAATGRRPASSATTHRRAGRASIEDPEAFGRANAHFHERLVALAGNQTLAIVAEMLNEIVARAVTEVSQAEPGQDSIATRRRGIRSQRAARRAHRGRATPTRPRSTGRSTWPSWGGSCSASAPPRSST